MAPPHLAVMTQVLRRRTIAAVASIGPAADNGRVRIDGAVVDTARPTSTTVPTRI